MPRSSVLVDEAGVASNCHALTMGSVVKTKLLTTAGVEVAGLQVGSVLLARPPDRGTAPVGVRDRGGVATVVGAASPYR